jgi:hypothetical protein
VRQTGLGRDSEGEDVPAVHVRCVRGEDQHMPMRAAADLAGSLRGIPAERTAATRLQEVGRPPRGDDAGDLRRGRRPGLGSGRPA